MGVVLSCPGPECLSVPVRVWGDVVRGLCDSDCASWMALVRFELESLILAQNERWRQA